ncbi:MAG TPA: AAA domain-containing protein [Tepidisphaeraceae bacterium]|nr:AAA domain-containing protein [Tepidisphaeraceae bacterium]
MIEPNNPILKRMLDRLFTSMLNGPSMNCRPHASRQRLDLSQLAKFKDAEPVAVLLALMKAGEAAVAARVPAPAKAVAAARDDEAADRELTPEDRAARQAWSEQQSLLGKLRVIADDARTYEQDTGVHALNIGFPLLSLPPGTFGTRGGGTGTRRIVAPIAFIPVNVVVKTGARQVVEVSCRGGGSDLVIPNVALLAWLEQQTGKPLTELFADESGTDPWREISEITKVVAAQVDLPVPASLSEPLLPEDLPLRSTPRAEDDEGGAAIILAAVLGLFPASNQGLLRDTREMIVEGVEVGPIESFVRAGVSLDVNPNALATSAPEPARLEGTRKFGDERIVQEADPCQAKAVQLARERRGLVVHGPPGTGKSQTITNIIGDHLARGQRVLFVCDKRTALDVVADRLQAIGLGQLCATVHDPQRDQRELYKSVREQLDALADEPVKVGADARLAKVDAELSALHQDLLAHHRALMGQNGGPGSFHHLMGQWLASAAGDANVDEAALESLPAREFDRHAERLKEVLRRSEAVGYQNNPWRAAAGMALPELLAEPMQSLRDRMAWCRQAAAAADARRNQFAPPFMPTDDLSAEGESRRAMAGELNAVLSAPDPESRARWAAEPLERVRVARQELMSLGVAEELLRSTAQDPELFTRMMSSQMAPRFAGAAVALDTYADAYTRQARELQRIRSVAGIADDSTILRWMAADSSAVAAARKRLMAAAPLAKAVESSVLDASLAARLDAAPLDAARVTEWLAGLGEYLETAGKWYAIFQGARKRSARPAAAHFGMALNATSAAQIRQFLLDLQSRQNLQAAVQAATDEAFESRADDNELLSVFQRNFAVLNALSPRQPAEPEPAAPDALRSADVAAANSLVRREAEDASVILAAFGLPLDPAAATRLSTFLKRSEAKRRIEQFVRGTLGVKMDAHDASDGDLLKAMVASRRLLDFLLTLTSVSPEARAGALHVLATAEAGPKVVEALVKEPQRAAAIQELERTMAGGKFFASAWVDRVAAEVRSGAACVDRMDALSDAIETYEGVLRVRDGLTQMPPQLSSAAIALVETGIKASVGFAAVRRAVLACEIRRRLRANPNLQAVDGERLRTGFDRYRALSDEKRSLVRDSVLHRWVALQKDRLLVGTGTRLNGTGADLRRRLTIRGERALRLRQVIAHGAKADGGDPLFDLRPVWMASPETVAQLFPRLPVFDVIVFDEASQCRLEEALPLLTRAKRVVIAGDPKQLPPTRFFESAVTASGADDAETEQELFEVHQGEVEDLLTAALGLDIQQCYLDVHYRSRNADLIAFSNEQFYNSRLQAIPGHPRNRIRYAPLTLYRVDGVYEKRRNVAEAEQVCKIVHDLLRRAAPPSIGIACFNLVQRDLILDKLEELAESDGEFARRLAAARERREDGANQGLFVKNLENVQGDERDHIIISTTYGPDAEGKFRRSFGPVGSAGGGRRLNVLVTRAREELHVVTSIPRSAYAGLSQLPSGVAPSGAWLLFAYLAFAEQLADEYETAQRILEGAGAAARASVIPRPTKAESTFAKALGSLLAARQNLGSDVHWGNDGFCIDLALHHPTRAEDMSIGVLCDTTRYPAADDPVDWEVFRTRVHENQGWKLHRIWTPHFFRDPDGAIAALVQENQSEVAAEVRLFRQLAEGTDLG